MWAHTTSARTTLPLPPDLPDTSRQLQCRRDRRLLNRASHLGCWTSPLKFLHSSRGEYERKLFADQLGCPNSVLVHALLWDQFCLYVHPKKEKYWLKTNENPCRDLTIPFEQHMMAMARWTPSLSWFYSCSKTGWGCRDAGNHCCVSSLSQSSIIFKGSLKLTLMSADDDFCIVLRFTLLSVPLRTEPSALELVTCSSCVIRVACLQLMDALLHCPCHIRNDWSCLNALPTSLLTASALCPSVRKHQQLLVMRIDGDDLFPHKYLSELHGCLLGGTQEHQITRQAAATTRKTTPFVSGCYREILRLSTST